MPHFTSRKSSFTILSALLLVLASLALAACGSSSSSSSKTTAGAPTVKAAAARTRFAAIRECLRKNGVALSSRTPGQPPRRGYLPGGAPVLPKGMTPQRYQAAIKKCGGLARPARPGRVGGRLQSPAFKHALANFAACLRKHGIDIPAPNTTGRGPVFNTNGIDVAGAKFKAARQKCASILSDTFRTPRGGGVKPGG